MECTKLLIKTLHFFWMRWSIISFFSVPCFCCSFNSALSSKWYWILPWCFLSLMTLVVAGPKYIRLTKPVRNIVPKGINTLYRFFSCMVPPKPESVLPPATKVPGNVRASTTGSAVCMPTPCQPCMLTVVVLQAKYRNRLEKLLAAIARRMTVELSCKLQRPQWKTAEDKLVCYFYETHGDVTRLKHSRTKESSIAGMLFSVRSLQVAYLYLRYNMIGRQMCKGG